MGTAVFSIGMLFGCGSSNGDLHSVHGIVATGAVMSGASIAVKCADGLVASTTTETDGSFSTLARGNFPCLIEASDSKRKLHSVATSSARVAVTPLTEQLVGSLSQDAVDTAAFFATFDASQVGMLSSDKLKAAQALVLFNLKSNGYHVSAINNLMSDRLVVKAPTDF